MKIEHFSEVPETSPVEGITKKVLIGAPQGAENFVMRLFELKPGVSTPYHEHPWEHEVHVLGGCGFVRDSSGGESALAQGYSVFVAPGEEHCFTNNGREILRFICVIPAAYEG